MSNFDLKQFENPFVKGLKNLNKDMKKFADKELPKILKKRNKELKRIIKSL